MRGEFRTYYNAGLKQNEIALRADEGDRKKEQTATTRMAQVLHFR
jgi:hypothetical protein